ncbi:hypothetical protein QFC21_001300 [Naganishia friedmannii]|uniref:Uncharacterized protein n=1 Tax=Naganishia friedmannii TaxID=89922 RepID=A0ACC2W6A5_9TREE|nr:hypothetical protein QFC21_001300 [Naganishia friedmannii]
MRRRPPIPAHDASGSSDVDTDADPGAGPGAGSNSSGRQGRTVAAAERRSTRRRRGHGRAAALAGAGTGVGMTTTTMAANAAAASRPVQSSSSASSQQQQQQQQHRTLTGPLSLFSTPLLDSFFPFPEPVLPVPAPFFPVWAAEDGGDGEAEEWTHYFTVEPSSQYGHHHPRNTTNPACDLLVAPVAWTTMKQVLEWRSRRVSGAGGAVVVSSMPAESIARAATAGAAAEPSSQRFRNEVEHVVENWEAVTARGMMGVLLPGARRGTAAAAVGTGTGTGNVDEIYTSFQPLFRAAQGAGAEEQVRPERFLGPWSGALDAVREQVGAEEYVYAGWGKGGGEVITYTVSVGMGSPLTVRDVIVCLHSAFVTWIQAKPATRAEEQARTTEPAARQQQQQQQQRSGIPTLIYLLYLAVTLYFLFLLSRASAMHSRFGIAFTGVIQVLCSAVMSFSVMAFLGFGWGHANSARNAAGETVVPYYLMPLVILIVGVENMATLIKAVYSTPITYSVPDRIGFGLAKAGPTLFITSVSDILALCFIAWTVKLGPVRDLCLYASVLIFVDWWMLHTFFLTVVSIDCQRLELADLLRQGVEQPRKAQLQIQVNSANGKHGAEGDRHGADVTVVRTGGRRTRAGAGGGGAGGGGGGTCADVKTLKSEWIKGAKSIWKARTARGGSMVLLLSLVTGVYYINESHQKDRLARILGYGLARSDKSIDLTELYYEPAPTQAAMVSNLPDSMQRLWHTLNPNQQPSINVCVFPTRAFIIPSADVKITPSQLIGSLERMSRPLLPRIKPLFYLLKVVILPQLVTAFLLWLVLLYLLKDADLLDAQGDRANVDDAEDEQTPSDDNGPMPGTRLGQIVRQATSNAIPTIDLADVLEIWTDEASLVVVVADSDNKMRVVEDDMAMSVAFADYPGRRECVNLGQQGKRLAVAGRGGMVRIFDVKQIRSSTNNASTFDCSLVTASAPRMVLLLDNTSPFSIDCSAVTIHGNGMILLHTSANIQPVVLRDALQSTAESFKLFARETANGSTRFAASAPDGTVEEWQSINGSWTITGRVHLDSVSIVNDCLLSKFAGDQFWFTASDEGNMQLSSYPDNHVIQTWKLSDDPITKLDIAHSDPEPCTRCSLFQNSLTCDVLYWTHSAVGRTALSFELPSTEVCTCNRHPGGRASLSRPVDHTPLRTYGTAKRQSHSGSSHKHRSTSPSPLSKQSQLSVDHNTLLGAPGTHSRTESEEEMLLHSSDGNAQREWTVHRVSHKVWHMHRGTAVYLSAVKLLVILGKAKRDWQATLVDLNDVAETDAELSLPLGMVLRPTKSLDSVARPSKQKMTKLAFSSIKSAAAGGRTILFGQGNVLIRLQVPAVNDASSVKRRVSTVFTVPQSANGTLSSRSAHTPIPLRLNGTGIPQS